MDTDSNYWDRLEKAERFSEGFYWYRDKLDAAPEIIELMWHRTDIRFFSDDPAKLHLHFAFGYSEPDSFTVEELLRMNPNAQISIEQIRPPNG